MKKILYITNEVVPYRTRFFNLLSKSCDLKVVYQTDKTGLRNSTWRHSVELNFKHIFLKGSFISSIIQLISLLSTKWDVRIIGCLNEKVEILAMLYLRLFHIPYYLNLDGETFFEGDSLKAKLKRFIAKGAKKYLVAGNEAAKNLRKAIGNIDIQVYNFSSLSEQELISHRHSPCILTGGSNTRYTLVVGAFLPYKGLDIALEAAKMLPDIQFKFIGANKQAGDLKALRDSLDIHNVEIIPFLQSEELYKYYQNCSFFVLPSRQECWGLVVNEAASYGTPIISTWGSGAAVEFLADKYPQYLAKSGDTQSLKDAITCYLKSSDAEKNDYSKYLIEKSKNYSIEESVRRHLDAFESC